MSRSPLLLLPLLLLAACDQQAKPAGPTIAVSPLQLNWYAGPQHGGCIAAATESLAGEHGVIGIENGGPNVPVEQRVRQIVINMERARWLPADLRNTMPRSPNASLRRSS